VWLAAEAADLGGGAGDVVAPELLEAFRHEHQVAATGQRGLVPEGLVRVFAAGFAHRSCASVIVPRNTVAATDAVGFSLRR
jgi:hypothetical protein